MACMSTLCKRLKMIFSWDRWMTRGRRREVRTSPDGGSLTVSVNPFAPFDEDSLARTRTTRDEYKNARSRIIRRTLRFGSCSGESSPERSLSITRSHEPLEPSSCSSVGRYQCEFVELEHLGSGQFGSVYRCLHRLDGFLYAVKRSKPVARNPYAHRRACNEVHANAALGSQPHVVRYFSAWMEEERLSIQQEYCNGGDLAGLLARMRRERTRLEEPELRRLVRHVAEGLRSIHRMKLAHMDIKPDNVFICRSKVWKSRLRVDLVGNGDDLAEEIIYKIGDLGHVTSIVNTKELEDEGDCRYLSREILREDFRDLTKADIFAFGLTIYEAAGGGPLPKNGPEWHDIRNGNVKKITHCSNELDELIKIMIHPDPEKRPSAANLVKREFPINQCGPTTNI
ncbi:PREDICTED: wee1-like protein kinase [Ceratosolen solmsi marchali]|uniref:Wee1-like protein kinase n=1 Tax=Ceratosolen solmsi marchali TaxID=326594 RepID=A0AAJ6YJ24_9HYME|nr:PREDICTED: wee1-like protein kinase [Ceratosolen solmsi marchali]